jgi:parvulin-like peptidyl-prolyl isomerase
MDYQVSFREIKKDPVDQEENLPPHVLTEDRLKTEILTQMLIPMAAVQGHYKDRIPEILAAAKDIRSKIAQDGSNFPQVAAAFSKDTNAQSGGSLGTLPRRGMTYPISRMAFSAEPGTVVGPFFSLVGCHILFVEAKNQGVVPSNDTLRASHILLPYEENRPDFIVSLLSEIVKKAEIEILDSEYAPYVQLDNLQEKGDK